MAHKGTERKTPMDSMFSLGTEEHELRRCLVDSQKRLIISGARAQNLPRDKVQAISFVVGLPEDAMNVIRDWFLKHCVFVDMRPPSVAINILRALPPESVTDEAMKLEWRSVLSAFAQTPMPAGVKEFLESRPPRTTQPSMPAALAPAAPITPPAMVLTVSGEAVKACQALLLNNAAPTGADAFAAVVTGVLAAARGDGPVLEKAKTVLAASGTPLADELLGLIGSAERKVEVGRTGDLRLARTISLRERPDFDPQSALVVAQVTTVLPSGQFFARVLGAVVGPDLLELSPDEARAAYKASGDVTAFANTMRGIHPDGETSLWRVTHRDTDKNTQFVITGQAGRVYDVVDVPHTCSEPDQIRQWLQEAYEPRTGLVPIFRLSDSKIVRIPGDVAPSVFRFDKPLEGFASLNGFKLASGRQIVIGPLPAPSQKYACFPPTTIIKRVLGIRDKVAQFPPFSKAQVQALCDFIASDDGDALGPDLARIVDRLASAGNLKEQLDESVEKILTLPTVAARIQEETSEVVMRFTASRAAEEKDVARLRDEKRRLAGEIESSRKAVQQQESELTRQIVATFEKASGDGIKTLAQVALFRGFFGDRPGREQSRNEVARPDANTLGLLETGTPLNTTQEVSRALKRCREATGLSARMFETIVASARACGVVGLIGARRTLVSSMLARVLAGNIHCSMSISGDMFSLSDLLRAPALVQSGVSTTALALGDFLDRQAELGRCSVVEFTGANRVPPEAFFPELLKAFTWRGGCPSVAWRDADGRARSTTLGAPLLLLLDFASGKSTFPLVEPLSLEIPLVSVDHMWGDEGDPDRSLAVETTCLTTEAWMDLAGAEDGRPEITTQPELEGAAPQISIAVQRLGCDSAEAALLSRVVMRGGRPGHAVDSFGAGLAVPGHINLFAEALRSCKALGFTDSSTD